MICGSRGSKSRLAKGAGAEPSGQMRDECMPLWREVHFEVKSVKTYSLRPLLEVEMSKKCTPLWREAHFEVKMYKAPHVRATFGGSDVVSHGSCKGLCTFSKIEQNVRVL